jgi:hypothetical protein
MIGKTKYNSVKMIGKTKYNSVKMIGKTKYNSVKMIGKTNSGQFFSSLLCCFCFVSDPFFFNHFQRVVVQFLLGRASICHNLHRSAKVGFGL